MAKKVEVKTTEVEVVEPDTTQNDKVEEKTVVKEKKAKQEKVKADKNNKNQKKGKNVKEKRGLGKRLKESMSELKKVSWPTFGHTVKQTGVVITDIITNARPIPKPHKPKNPVHSTRKIR